MTKRPSHSSCLARALRQVKLLCLIAWGFLKTLGRGWQWEEQWEMHCRMKGSQEGASGTSQTVPNSW